MPTGLDVAAGVAGLITLADIVIDRTYRTIKACKNASEDSKRLLRETQALLGVLTGLLKLAEQVNKTSLASHITPETVHDCQQTLMKIRDKLVKAAPDESGISKMTKVARTLKWPFTSRETDEILEQLQRYKSEFDLSLTMDVLENLLHHESDMWPKIDQLARSVKDLARISTDQERLSVLRFYHTFDPERNHETNIHLRQAGTGLWLTRGDDFDAWKTNSNSKLWIYGIPGAGKTVCTAALIDEVAQIASAEYALAYFYCDYKSESTLQLQNLLASIAGQLARQHEHCFQKLLSSYRPKNDQPPRHSLPSVDELTRLIRAMITHFDDVAVVVDGVDECFEPGEVAFKLAELSLSCPKLRMILTSRREQIIESNLCDFTSISVAAQSDDLKLYVSSQLDERTRKGFLRLNSSALKDEILEKLITDADGMFRWVACQIDHLCRLPTDALRRKALSSLPPDLYTTYDRILQRISLNGPESSDLAQRTLRWLYTNDPFITPDQLCEALSISQETQKLDADAVPAHTTILRLCGSLIREHSHNGMLEVEYAHFTVKEYLSSERVREDERFSLFFCSDEIVNDFKARTCMKYLSLPDFRNRRSSKWQESAAADPEKHFYAFACRHFSHFYHEIPNEGSTFELLSQFFTELPGNLDTWKPSFLLLSHLQSSKMTLIFNNGAHSLEPDDTNAQSTSMDLKESFGTVTPPVARIKWNDPKRQDHDEEYFQTLWFRILAISRDSAPIHYASMLRLPGIVDLLASRGADVNLDGALATPMECAIRGGSYRFTLGVEWKESFDNREWYTSHKCAEYTVSNLALLGSTPLCFWSDAHAAIMMNIAILTRVAIPLLQTMDHVPREVLKMLPEIEDHPDFDINEDLLAAFRSKVVNETDVDILKKLLINSTCIISNINEVSRIADLDLDSQFFEQLIERALESDDISELRLLINSTRIDCCQWASRCGESMLQMATNLVAQETFDFLLEHHKSTECAILHWLNVPKAPALGKSGSLDAGPKKGEFSPTDHLWQWARSTYCEYDTHEHPENRNSSRHAKFLRGLLEIGADPLRYTNNGETILYEVLKGSIPEKLSALKNALSTVQLRTLTAISFTGDGTSCLPIEVAAESGFYGGLDLLLSRSADLKDTQQVFRRTIRGAARSEFPLNARWVRNLEKIAEYGEDVMCRNVLGETSVHELVAQLPKLLNASPRKYVVFFVTDVLGVIQTRNEDPFTADNSGATPLHTLSDLIANHTCSVNDRACRANDGSGTSCALNRCLGVFLSKKADVLCRQSEGLSVLDILFRGACESNSAAPRQLNVNRICLRAFHEALKSVEYCEGSDIGAIRWKSWSALGLASWCSEDDLATRLIDLGANVDEIDDLGWGPCIPVSLMLTSKCNHTTIKVALSKSQNTHWRDEDGLGLIHLLAFAGGDHSDAETLKLLLDAGLALEDTRNRSSWTPLDFAARRGKINLVTDLLQAGADVNRSSDGWTAIGLACLHGHHEVVRLLKKEGAHLDFCVRQTDLFDLIDAPYEEMQCCVSLVGLAAISGSLETIKVLLETEALRIQQAEPTDKPSPVWWASYRGDDVNLGWLIEQGLDVQSCEASQRLSPLHIACSGGHIGSMKVLINHGCDPKTRDILQRNAMDHVLLSGSSDAAKFLSPLLAGPQDDDHDPKGGKASTETPDGICVVTSLPHFVIQVLKEGNLSQLKILQAQGIDLCAPLACGCDALLVSLIARHYDICKYLLRIGIPTSRTICKSNCFATRVEVGADGVIDSLFIACRDDVEITGLLLERTTKDCDWEARIHLLMNHACLHGNMTSLKAIAQHYMAQQDTDIVRLLVSQNEDLPLHACSRNDHREAARFLLTLGMPVDTRDSALRTALHIACINRNLMMTQLLLDHGANPNAFTVWCTTPLLEAVRGSSTEIIELLLERGGDPNIRDGHDRSLLCNAILYGELEVITFLLSSGISSWSLESDLTHLALLNEEGHAVVAMVVNSETYRSADHGLLAVISSEVVLKMLLRATYCQRLLGDILKACSRNIQLGEDGPGLEHVSISPLHTACAAGLVGPVKLLIEAGSMINIEDGPLGTPLMYASYYGRSEIAKLLVRAGAVLSYSNGDRVFSAIKAAQYFPEIVEWLLVGRFTEQQLLGLDSQKPSTELNSARGDWTFAPATNMRYVPWDNREFIYNGEAEAFIARVRKRMQVGPFVAREDGWTEMVQCEE